MEEISKPFKQQMSCYRNPFPPNSKLTCSGEGRRMEETNQPPRHFSEPPPTLNSGERGFALCVVIARGLDISSIYRLGVRVVPPKMGPNEGSNFTFSIASSTPYEKDNSSNVGSCFLSDGSADGCVAQTKGEIPHVCSWFDHKTKGSIDERGSAHA